MGNCSLRRGTFGFVATLIAGMLLVGVVASASAGAVATPSSSLKAVHKPGASCAAKLRGRKAMDGKLTLICKKVGKHYRWETVKTVKTVKSVAKGPTVAQVKKSFSTDVAPAESTLESVLAKAEAPGFVATPASVAALSAPLIVACKKMDAELTAMQATGTLGTEIQSYVAADRVIVTLLESAGSQTTSSLPAWGITLKQDAKILKMDSNVLRSALGLPPAL